MKYIKNGLFFLLTFLAFASCQKEYSIENGIPTIPGVTGQWEFTEGTNLFKGPIDTAYLDDVAGVAQILSIEGTAENGTDKLYIQISDNVIKVGTYKSPQVQITYLKNGNGGTPIYKTDNGNAGNLILNITNIDTVGVTGTFSGIMLDANNASKNITGGKFTAKFKTSKPPATGQVTLWAKQLCSGSAIKVFVGRDSANITAVTATEPTSCGATGNATFTLPAGSYIWKAICGTNEVTGNISVLANTCIKQEVSFVVAQNCKIEKLLEMDPGSLAAGYALINSFGTNNLVNKLQFVDSSNTPPTLDNSFDFIYSGVQIKLDANQYYTVGTAGKIIQFNGYLDPTDNTTEAIVTKYIYNTAGLLSKIQVAAAAAPTVVVFEYNFTYTGTNLSKTTILYLTKKVLEATYEYDATKTIKNFVDLHFAPDLFYFGSVVNVGQSATNALTKIISQNYDLVSGSLTSTDTQTYFNYNINAAGYVQSFEVGGDDIGGLFFISGQKYVLTYKCF